METIRIEKISRIFNHLTAVDGISLSVEEGEIFGLVGPDGAGKTTIMRMLSGVLAPTSGDAWVVGRSIVDDPESVKERIGYMSQRFGLYQDLTVFENLSFYADIYGVPQRGRSEKFDDLLSFSNLAPFKGRLAGNLSGGMKQKLGLACALVHTPKVLLLDEPTNGVDPVSRREFWRILYRLLSEKVTIFVSTSYLDEAERCGRLGLLHNGRILACGTPWEIKKMMKGALLQISGPKSRKIASALMTEFPKNSVSLFGGAVHMVADGTESKHIADLLSEKRIAFDEIVPIQPSIEDVFVSVLSPTGENSNGR